MSDWFLPDGVRGDYRVHRVRRAGRACEAVVFLRVHRRCLPPSSTRSSEPGPGVAAGSPKSDFRTSRAPPSCTRRAAGPRSRARSWSAHGGASSAQDGTVKSTPPSNVPAVTLGVFILWLGWFGFNGGSQLALGGAADAVAISNILANTNLAAAAGVMAAISLSRPVLGRVDLLAGLNGAIAGLVAITAGPDIVDHHWAVIIGAVGGAVCVFGLKAHGAPEDRRRGGGDPRPPLRRNLGHARGMHRRRRRSPGANHRRGGHRYLRVRLTSWVIWVVPSTKPSAARISPNIEYLGTGCRRTRHRSLSRVRTHAGGARRRLSTGPGRHTVRPRLPGPGRRAAEGGRQMAKAGKTSRRTHQAIQNFDTVWRK